MCFYVDNEFSHRYCVGLKQQINFYILSLEIKADVQVKDLECVTVLGIVFTYIACVSWAQNHDKSFRLNVLR